MPKRWWKTSCSVCRIHGRYIDSTAPINLHKVGKTFVGRVPSGVRLICSPLVLGLSVAQTGLGTTKVNNCILFPLSFVVFIGLFVLDGGEGNVGTVCEIGKSGTVGSPDKTVVVQWDNGTRTNYRVGYLGKFDLRVIDNAQIGKFLIFISLQYFLHLNCANN